eukprot:scaffold276_cov132-Cylindrotheca_fusiformis.AAC.15
MEETDQHQLQEVSESQGKEDIATLSSDDADDAAEERDTLGGVSRKYWYYLMALILFLCIAVGATAGVLLSSKSDDHCDCAISTPVPSSAATTASPEDLLDMQSLARFVLPGVDISDLSQTAPQYRALQWLVHDVPRRTIEDNSTELLELFSLVTLYYATDNSPFYGWLSDLSYCNWNYFISCNWNGRVSEFHLLGLSGTLPPEIGNLQDLAYFAIYDSTFSGNIPSEIGNLQQVSEIQLWGNIFSGTIPSEIGNMEQLVHLEVQYNTFSGTLPSEIGNLQQLTSLRIQSNRFSGTLPSEIGNLQQLTSLGIQYNTFSGTLDTGCSCRNG